MKKCRQYGFSLIELLIVISIIAILVSVLLPALRKARESSRGIACMNNNRQLSLLLVSYADNYKEYCPFSSVSAYCLVEMLSDKSVVRKNIGGIFLCPSLKEVSGAGSYQTGYSFSWGSLPLGGNHGGCISYAGGLTNWFPRRYTELLPDSVVLVEKSMLQVSGGIALAHPYATYYDANSYFSSVGTAGEIFTAGYGTHNNFANFLFADGHVQKLKAGTQFTNEWALK